jgi:tRNA threonylcarbamoyl adenosine modification protein (Sua5/YciO/YrdC/YwlC family)
LKTRVVKIDPDNFSGGQLKEAAAAVAAGRFVVFPTETVYGVGTSADDAEAVAGLVRLRSSPEGRPFTVHLASADDVPARVTDVPPSAHRLMRRFWPGPLTVVLNGRGGRTVGLRIPDHKVACELIRLSGVGLAGASANLAGRPPATDAAGAAGVFDGHVDFVIDAGECRLKNASTVVRLTDGKCEILREGAVPRTEIEKLAGFQVLFVCTGNTCRSPMAAGLLRKMLADELKVSQPELAGRGFTVLSAGTASVDGIPASENAVGACAELGCDISRHESRTVTPTLIEESDLVLAMTRGHVSRLADMMPECRDRIHLLRVSGHDVDDPIGGAAGVYRKCAATIRHALEAWKTRILYGGR